MNCCTTLKRSQQCNDNVVAVCVQHHHKHANTSSNIAGVVQSDRLPMHGIPACCWDLEEIRILSFESGTPARDGVLIDFSEKFLGAAYESKSI